MNKVDGIYGYRRMTMNLNRTLSKSINHKRVLPTDENHRNPAVIRRKRKKYRSSTPRHVAENVLNRRFQLREAK